MAGYIPWFGKKRERLALREHELFVLLQRETDASKLNEAVESVRAAQIRALKAKRAQLPPSVKNATAFLHLDQEIQFWRTLTPAQIIDGYRSGKYKGHRSRTVRRSRPPHGLPRTPVN